jgi:hypothetical protein
MVPRSELAQAAAFMARIQDVSGANLDRNTDSLAGCFFVAIFIRASRKMPED